MHFKSVCTGKVSFFVCKYCLLGIRFRIVYRICAFQIPRQRTSRDGSDQHREARQECSPTCMFRKTLLLNYTHVRFTYKVVPRNNTECWKVFGGWSTLIERVFFVLRLRKTQVTDLYLYIINNGQYYYNLLYSMVANS